MAKIGRAFLKGRGSRLNARPGLGEEARAPQSAAHAVRLEAPQLNPHVRLEHTPEAQMEINVSLLGAAFSVPGEGGGVGRPSWSPPDDEDEGIGPQSSLESSLKARGWVVSPAVATDLPSEPRREAAGGPQGTLPISAPLAPPTIALGAQPRYPLPLTSSTARLQQGLTPGFKSSD